MSWERPCLDVSTSATVATNIIGLVKLYREYEPPKYWVIKQANYMVIWFLATSHFGYEIIYYVI